MRHEPLMKGASIEQFSAVVKPTGSKCNMKCQYCFYLHKNDLLKQSPQPRMSDFILELHIKQHIEAQSCSYVDFIWQGGEPTLLGLPYFEKIIKLQRKYKKKDQDIFNSLQTNGILIDEKWCKFLKKNNFLVGLSIDGPKNIHDKYRLSNSGRSTYPKIMNAVKLLKKYDIDFNVLCAVNADNSKKPLEVYRFIRDEVKPNVIQFTPVVQKVDFKIAPPIANNQHLKSDSLEIPKETHPPIVTDWSVKPDYWGSFLVAIWKEWIEHDFGNVFIDNFEDSVAILLGFGSQKCTSNELCGKGLAIEHNGDVYSCDHFVYPDYYLGNITKTHQADIISSIKQRRFGLDKRDKLPTTCKQCTYLKLCGGECPRNRFTKTPDNKPGLNYLCKGQQTFFKHVIDDINILNNKLKRSVS
ncbi:anaerobic sulfatase maturase [Photobacterium sp. DNB23_23_1]